MFFIDPLYIVFALPGLLLALFATMKTKSAFHKYSKYGAASGLTGAEAAQRMLSAHGLRDVSIEPTRGFLSDHYDPRSKTLRLSPSVYQSRSLSAIGVACHEAGHAFQHAENYTPLALRSALVPATQFGSRGAYICLLAGLFLSMPFLAKLGAILFIAVVVFSIVTLPVEWDATARAKQFMTNSGIVTAAEEPHVAKVLNAAFLTYVATAVTALLQLLYFLTRAGLLGGDD